MSRILRKNPPIVIVAVVTFLIVLGIVASDIILREQLFRLAYYCVWAWVFLTILWAYYRYRKQKTIA